MLETELMPAALKLAYEKHAGQKDKQGLPYILHPLAVMANVMNHEKYPALSPKQRLDICCIAILHDVVEDTEVTMDDIRGMFGDGEIAAGVDAMTHRPDEPVETYWERAKADYLARIVKLCDIRHNSLPERAFADPERRKRSEEKYARAYRALRFTTA